MERFIPDDDFKRQLLFLFFFIYRPFFKNLFYLSNIDKHFQEYGQKLNEIVNFLHYIFAQSALTILH